MRERRKRGKLSRFGDGMFMRKLNEWETKRLHILGSSNEMIKRDNLDIECHRQIQRRSSHMSMIHVNDIKEPRSA